MTIDIRPADYLSREELRALAYTINSGWISRENADSFGEQVLSALLKFGLLLPAWGNPPDETPLDEFVPRGADDLSQSTERRKRAGASWRVIIDKADPNRQAELTRNAESLGLDTSKSS